MCSYQFPSDTMLVFLTVIAYSIRSWAFITNSDNNSIIRISERGTITKTKIYPRKPSRGRKPNKENFLKIDNQSKYKILSKTREIEWPNAKDQRPKSRSLPSFFLAFFCLPWICVSVNEWVCWNEAPRPLIYTSEILISLSHFEPMCKLHFRSTWNTMSRHSKPLL